jgi:N-glycosidase YbiA
VSDRILFQSKAAPEFRFLSNFHLAPISVGDDTFASNEHFYQACKTTNDFDYRKVRDAKTCGQARRLGQEVKCREDWERPHPCLCAGVQLSVKDHAMYQGCLLKFWQNEDIRKQLLDTGERELVEFAPWGDEYWGATVNPDGTLKGKNRLGQILAMVRDTIRKTPTP